MSERESEGHPGRTRRRPVEENDPNRPPEGRERPNPCAPERDPDDCECPKPPTQQDPTPKPRRPRPRPDSCCDQLIEILGRVPGLEVPKPHKPKQRPERKTADLCEAFGVADAILPLLAVLWERWSNGEKGRNEFEYKLFGAFDSWSEEERSAMEHAFKEYIRLRRKGKAECLFNDCLADAAKEGPVEGSWVIEEIIREGLKVAGTVVFDHSGGEIGPGQVRVWDNKVFHGPNGSGALIFQGPWPWLTSIATNHTSAEEYGNVESFRPIPGGAHIWQNYQFAQECEFVPGSSGTIHSACQRKHPAPPPPGGFLAGYCEGGMNYTLGNDCIRIPAQLPGGSLKLRGFNFIAPTVKVVFTLLSDPSVTWEEECAVWGDRATPVKDKDGHTIVDERVHDWVDVSIRNDHPFQVGGKLPPGIYSVVVKVANVTSAIYDGAVAPFLTSNALLVRIEADPSTKYLFWSERGRCNRETPGMGDDEIWWDTWAGHIVPTAVPVPPDGSAPLELRDLDHRWFPRAPWEDMDDGENAGAYKQDVWGPAAFELYGVVAIAVVGFEVDSEAEARNQTRSFGEAFGRAMEAVVAASIAGEGLAAAVAKAVSMTLTGMIIVLAIIAAIVLISAIFWSAWAPADLIALDLMAFDSLSSWDKTDPKKPLPPDVTRLFDDDIGGGGVAAQGSVILTATEHPLPKVGKPNEAACTWVQENTYDTPEHGEDASYTLEFRLART